MQSTRHVKHSASKEGWGRGVDRGCGSMVKHVPCMNDTWVLAWHQEKKNQTKVGAKVGVLQV